MAFLPRPKVLAVVGDTGLIKNFTLHSCTFSPDSLRDVCLKYDSQMDFG